MSSTTDAPAPVFTDSSSSKQKQSGYTTPPKQRTAQSVSANSPSLARADRGVGGMNPKPQSKTHSTSTSTSVSTSASALHLSPAYKTNLRKHSVYGTEDRVVIDPGSRIWKIGFSGESRPRKVFRVVGGDGFGESSTASSSSGLSTSASASKKLERELMDDFARSESNVDEASTIWDLDLGRMAENIRVRKQQKQRQVVNRRGSITRVGKERETKDMGISDHSKAQDRGVSGDADADVDVDAAGTPPSDEERQEQEVTVNDVDVDAEVDRLIKARLIRVLRNVHFKHLLTDSRSRNIIISENALLPERIKNLMIDVLFENLHVPTISFAPSQVLALMAVGRDTGLVVDVGYLETTVVPVFQSRVLYPFMTTTPRAGRAYLNRLRSLIAHFGTLNQSNERRPPYFPGRGATSASVQPSSSSASSSDRQVREMTPAEIEGRLNTDVLEDIRSRGCFVGDVPIPIPIPHPSSSFRQVSMDVDDNAPPEVADAATPEKITELEQRYQSTSSAVPAIFHLPTPPSSSSSPHRSASVIVPGWIRERTAEVFFETDDEDHLSIQQCILDSVVKLPIDLREPMISRILVIGGGGMVPGFMSRLRVSSLQALMTTSPGLQNLDELPTFVPSSSEPVPVASGSGNKLPTTSRRHRSSKKRNQSKPSTEYQKYVIRKQALDTRSSHHEPYRQIQNLASSFTILNEPNPLPPPEADPQQQMAGSRTGGGAGSTPAFVPSLLTWVGASIAGTLKIGGKEMTLEEYDQRKEMALDVEPVPTRPSATAITPSLTGDSSSTSTAVMGQGQDPSSATKTTEDTATDTHTATSTLTERLEGNLPITVHPLYQDWSRPIHCM